MHRTVIELVAAGRVDVLPLVTHVVPAPLAADAYALLDADPASALQIVLDFRPGTTCLNPRTAEPAAVDVRSA
jgi:hypothetical protein